MTPHLRVECVGSRENPAVLFLHGFLGSAIDWRDIATRLSDRLFCVSIDLPGHGGSVRLPEPSMYTFTGAAAGVLTVLRTLHVRAPMLVGYSMGARLALALALHTPNVFRRVVLESTSAGLASETERTARAEADDLLASRLETEALGAFLDHWYEQPLFASLRARPELLAAVKQGRIAQDGGELAKALRGLSVGRQASYWERLPNLVTPTLMISGELDEKYVDLGGEMAGLCYQGVTAIVPSAGHNVHLERPDAYAEIVGEFLAEP